MPKKKKKNAGEPALPAQPDAQPAPETPARPKPAGKRFLRVAVPVAAAAVLIGVAAALPGYEDPNREFTECKLRLDRISTALMMWALEHGENLPDSLEYLQQAGFLASSESALTCPASGKRFRYFGAGLERLQSLRAVAVAGPEGVTYTYRFPGGEREPVAVGIFIGADLRVHFEHPPKPGLDQSAAVLRQFAERLAQQETVMGLAKAARTDAQAQARLNALMLDRSKLDETRCLAAWAAGRSGHPGAAAAARACFGQARANLNDIGIAAASAMLRLGDLGGVDYLIFASASDDWAWRDCAAAALTERFRGAKPPMPALKPYLRDAAKPGTKSAVAKWWSDWRAANAGGTGSDR